MIVAIGVLRAPASVPGGADSWFHKKINKKVVTLLGVMEEGEWNKREVGETGPSPEQAEALAAEQQLCPKAEYS